MPLGPLGFVGAQHRRTPRASVESVQRKASIKKKGRKVLWHFNNTQKKNLNAYAHTSCAFRSSLANMQLNSCEAVVHTQPILQGHARVFACVKGILLAQVGDLPAVIRICGYPAPVFASSAQYLHPVSCEVRLFEWNGKTNVFYGDVVPLVQESAPKKPYRRRLQSM